MSSPLAKRDDHGRLVPGTPSLNPGGRPKGKGVRARIAALTNNGDDLVDRLNEIVNDPRTNKREVIQAAAHLLDRLEGKPIAKIESKNLNVSVTDHEHALDLDALSTDHLQTLAAILNSTVAREIPVDEVDGEIVEAPALPAGEPQVEASPQRTPEPAPAAEPSGGILSRIKKARP